MTDRVERIRIVLVHGITGSKRFYTGLENRLREQPLHAETLSFDLLGFGENRNAPSEYAIDDQLQHISRLIQDCFSDRQVVFIGHSPGGVLALSWAAQHPSRVSAIVLLNTPLYESCEDTTRSLLAGRFGWATLLLKYPRLAQLLCIVLRGGRLIRLLRFMKPSWVPDEVFRDYWCHSWKSLSRTFDEVLLRMPGAPLVRQISDIPILNLTGYEDDEISRRRMDQRNVENVVLPGGHLMLLEHPRPAMQAIEES
jgi:pimeloyl-ACP methyl ester carboxylesterase